MWPMTMCEWKVYSYHLVQCKAREYKTLKEQLSRYFVLQNVENMYVIKLLVDFSWWLPYALLENWVLLFLITV